MELLLIRPLEPRADDVSLEHLHSALVKAESSLCVSGAPFEIKCATLTKLVEHLTNPFTHGTKHNVEEIVAHAFLIVTADLEFMKTFLMTYHYFTIPETFLKLLLRRYSTIPGVCNGSCADRTVGSMENRPPVPIPVNFNKRYTLSQLVGAFVSNKTQVLTPIRLRVFNIFKTWLELYREDFNPIMLACLRKFAGELAPMMSKQICKLMDHEEHGRRKPKTLSDYQFDSEPPYPEVRLHKNQYPTRTPTHTH